MEHHDHTEDPLNEAPLLRSLKGRPDPFVAPEGFFERFPRAVQARVVKKEGGLLRGLWFPRLALALGLVTIVLAIWLAIPQINDPVDGPGVEQFAWDVFPEELPGNENFVWDLYLDHNEPLFGEVMLDLDERELFSYLEHENVDVELLMTEL